MLVTFIFVIDFTCFIMLRKEILPRLLAILGYSIDGWLAAYRCNDKDLQCLYDQLYKQTGSVLKFAKMIERYECSRLDISVSDCIADLVNDFNRRGKV